MPPDDGFADFDDDVLALLDVLQQLNGGFEAILDVVFDVFVQRVALKHVALVAILMHLAKKETPFAVIDSHAGRGLYDLQAEEARRTGEAANGIARLKDLEGPEALNRYLALVAESGLDLYPGSPLLTAKLLRPQVRDLALNQAARLLPRLPMRVLPRVKPIIRLPRARG